MKKASYPPKEEILSKLIAMQEAGEVIFNIIDFESVSDDLSDFMDSGKFLSPTQFRKLKNYLVAISTLLPNQVRKDHYDGEYGIYRFAAIVSAKDYSYPYEEDKAFLKLIEQLNSLPVRPNQVFTNNNYVEIVWYSRRFQVVSSQSQYAGLVLEFTKFLNECPIEGVISTGTFCDDPDDSVKYIDKKYVNFFPEFNSNCFGLKMNKVIQITDQGW